MILHTITILPKLNEAIANYIFGLLGNKLRMVHFYKTFSRTIRIMVYK